MKKLILLAMFAMFSTQAMADMYTDEITFVAMLQPGYYLEDFDAYNYLSVESLPPQDFGPVNGFSYTVSAPNGLWALPVGSGALSVNVATDAITVDFTGDPITAVGGLFFGTDYDGNITGASMIVTLSDGTVENYVTTGDAFRGFVSSTPISYLTISCVIEGVDYKWPTMDHFYVGSPVPVPGAVLLGILGLSAAGIKLRKFA
jgi:hypothetical protein